MTENQYNFTIRLLISFYITFVTLLLLIMNILIIALIKGLPFIITTLIICNGIYLFITHKYAPVIKQKN